MDQNQVMPNRKMIIALLYISNLDSSFYSIKVKFALEHWLFL